MSAVAVNRLCYDEQKQFKSKSTYFYCFYYCYLVYTSVGNTFVDLVMQH